MIILFDKTIDSNITKITAYMSTEDIDLTRYFYRPVGGNGLSVSDETCRIVVAGEATSITFKDLDSIKPYIEQQKHFDPQLISPAEKINTEPYYDKPKAGSIKPHTYVNTDIEKEYLNKK